ncbi:MAG TPA: 16S rRNA (adenine(1518)-N(6)/adenine(1519)-N(6))-dimethyltransferase RsmA [Terriglobia bacterium]|nr:16S rRNA (adenine(1518)-N(6)/adenine(1519)-N(6))-dimethyltransferase RsmA [Terriglobia bacterium]
MAKRHRPKLGQHFLSDARYCSRVADALEAGPGDLVIEIGPGHGAVTGLLASRARRVVAIEIDPELVEELRLKFQHSRNVEIVQGDILVTDLGEICRRHNVERCIVFGNLPYYITSPIIHHVLGFATLVRAMGLLVQREVADRLVAQPGSRDYGYLTVFSRLYSSARVVLQVPPGAFSPPPKVNSAFVRFEMYTSLRSVRQANEQEFLGFLKQCFVFKRKMLLNCLAPMYPRQRIEAELEQLGLPPGVRAEQLSLDQFIAIFSNLR